MVGRLYNKRPLSGPGLVLYRKPSLLVSSDQLQVQFAGNH